ncbi:HTH_Tnp_Tc3_2 domain-containing protein [Trichonephila clavipes]|nr:HTH_Tnp_Tc3_2 domain-containing protein [Trichonephila clavipes]
MQKGRTDQRGRLLPSQCTTLREVRQIVRMAVTDLSVTSRTLTQNIESVTHHSVSERTIRRRLHRSGLSARRSLLGLPLTQNHRRLRRQWCHERRISFAYRKHWSMVVQRLTQITTLAATPDQRWQSEEATWSAVPPKHIQNLLESIPRRVVAVISNNGSYSGY